MGERRERRGRTCHDEHRSFRGARSGWRAAGFGMEAGHEACDAELAAILYGLIHLVGRREVGMSCKKCPSGREAKRAEKRVEYFLLACPSTVRVLNISIYTMPSLRDLSLLLSHAPAVVRVFHFYP